MLSTLPVFIFFFFNDTATTEIYTLSLHDALPIWPHGARPRRGARRRVGGRRRPRPRGARSEEHTSELQSQSNLVCRLLLEKKKKTLNKRPQFTLVVHANHVHTHYYYTTYARSMHY